MDQIKQICSAQRFYNLQVLEKSHCVFSTMAVSSLFSYYGVAWLSSQVVNGRGLIKSIKKGFIRGLSSGRTWRDPGAFRGFGRQRDATAATSHRAVAQGAFHPRECPRSLLVQFPVVTVFAHPPRFSWHLVPLSS